jgi:hypothetical protein
VLIGSLPTLTPAHLVLANLSPNERYRALNDQMLGARGEQFSVDIRGVERLQTANDSIAPRRRCTSVQFHMQVPADRFAAHWNASQAIAGMQVAIGRTRRTCTAGTLGGNPDRAVRAGHRHPAGRAQGPGRTPAGVVR